MNNTDKIMYRVNDRDEIVFVNEEWLRYSLDNQTFDLTPDKVSGKSLWSFVTDETTQHLYREMMRQVRRGEAVTFTIRCDSAECRQLLEMTVSLLSSGEIQFETRTVWTEKREPQPLLESDAARSDELLRMCGWCKRVDVGENVWEEVENATVRLNLFNRQSLPQLTHGICHSCYAGMTEKLVQSKSEIR